MEILKKEKCQLSIEEIEHIDLCLNCDVLDEIDRSILNKLQKQKEMLNNVC